VADEDPLKDALQVATWAYERQEEIARLHHSRAQLVVTVVSAFLGIGILRVAAVGEGGEVPSATGAVLLALLLVAFLVSSMLAALYTLAGPPGSPWRRRTARASGLVFSPEDLADLAGGRREAAFAVVLGQSAEALEELSAENQARHRDIQTGLSWFILALFAAALAVTVHFMAAVELRMQVEATDSAMREEVRMLPSHPRGGDR
jgi:hypothetical protein